MKKIVCPGRLASLPIVFSFLYFVPCFAQTLTQNTISDKIQKLIDRQNDSLVYLIRTLPDDTLKVNIYHALAANLGVLSNYDSAITVAHSSYLLASQLREPGSIVKSLLTLGGAYGNFGSRDYEKSLQYYNKGAEVASEHSMYVQLHSSYYSILNLYFYSGDFPKAMELVTKGLSLAEENHDLQRIGHYHNLFGFIYLRQGNFAEAEKNYQMCLDLAKEIQDSIAIADAYNCLAEVFTSTNNFQKSLEYHFIGWRIYNRHYAAGVYFKHDQMAYTAFKISHVYKMMANFKEARKYSSKGFEFTRKHGTNEYDMVNYLLNASEIYKHTGEYEKSLEGLYDGLQLSKKIKHRENIRDSYFLLAGIYKQLKKYDSAYHYQVLYGALKDSIVNEQTRKEVQQIQATYSLEKKDREIESLQQQKRLSQAEAGRQRLVRNAVIIIMIFFLVLLYLIYNRYRLKQKNRFQMELNHQQNKMYNAIATLQDQERKRIAQDIHDSLGSILSTAKLRLSGMLEFWNNTHPQEKDYFQNVISLLDEAVTELRDISQNIMPATLSRLGLVAALQNLFDKITSYSRIHIHYNVHGISNRLDESTEIIIYRIILELVNNVVKHAQASNITVQLIQYSDHINATVEDDGEGFDLEQVKKRKQGVGLNNIISRLEYLKGNIEIDTKPGQGTSIAMDIPLVMNNVSA